MVPVVVEGLGGAGEEENKRKTLLVHGAFLGLSPAGMPAEMFLLALM